MIWMIAVAVTGLIVILKVLRGLKLNLYLVDLDNFAIVNKVMEEFFSTPFPARAAVGVKALPKGSQVEAEAVMVIGD